MDLKRLRVKLLVDVWGTIAISERAPTRDEVVELLKQKYSEYGIEPIKGAASPPDLFEKELISLYIVGKYGLGIDEDMGEIVSRVFTNEQKYEEAIRYVKELYSINELRDKIISLFNRIPDSATISKVLRFAFTLHYLGFESEDLVIEALRKLHEAFPELRDTIKRFARFFIASKIAEAIAKGTVKNWIEKEAYKQALALKIGLQRVLPDDEYVRKVSEALFALTPRKLNKILGKKSGGGDSS